jgi:hypothetical protein
MIKIFPQDNIVSHRNNLPQKSVTISFKNGKYVKTDEFVGFHAVRENPIEVFLGIFEDLIHLIGKKH